MKSRWFKATMTVFGAVMLSTLGIYASDKLQGIDTGVDQQVGARGSGTCREGMAPLKVQGTVLCVDIYEASPGEKCPYRTLSSILHSEQNANTKECYAISEEKVLPWNYVSLSQAQRMCAQGGKRLPTSEEWYHIALGTNVDGCAIDEDGVRTTGNTECISGIGAHDAIGNLWEWVDEQVVGNMYEGRALPEEGYVTSVDVAGIAITSGENADALYGDDYFWSTTEGVSGMIRGGFYGSDDDAGLYTVNASVPTNFATQGVGFRCVEDVL